MKKILLFILTPLLVGFLSIMMLGMMFMGATSGGDKTTPEWSTEDLLASQLEHFTINGTGSVSAVSKFPSLIPVAWAESESGYTLNFNFGDWSIKNIKFNASSREGTVVTSVKMPGFSGSNEAIAYQYFRSRGFTPEGACGLMANINHESGFNPVIIERTTRADKGYGICQWTFGRRTNIESWLRNKGIDPYSDTKRLYLAQLEYAITEPGYEGIVSRIKTCTSASKAASIWCKEWERPANASAQAMSRGEKAESLLTQYRNNSIRSGDTESATLSVKYEVENGEVIFNGKLDGTEIAGAFKTSDAKGEGEYGEGAVAFSTKGGVGNPYGDTKFYITELALIGASGPGWVHSGNVHSGWDLAVGGYSEIYAVTPGTVVHAGPLGGYGNHVVIIQSGSMYVLYGHMREMDVKVGDSVHRGRRIGAQGSEGNSTGPHLHLEFRRGSNSMSVSTAYLSAMKPMLQRWAHNYHDSQKGFKYIIR